MGSPDFVFTSTPRRTRVKTARPDIRIGACAKRTRHTQRIRTAPARGRSVATRTRAEARAAQTRACWDKNRSALGCAADTAADCREARRMVESRIPTRAARDGVAVELTGYGEIAEADINGSALRVPTYATSLG